MEVLATKEDYSNMKSVMQEFGYSIKKFRDECTMHAEILRRYDEVITTKASRFNLLEIEESIHAQKQRIDAF